MAGVGNDALGQDGEPPPGRPRPTEWQPDGRREVAGQVPWGRQTWIRWKPTEGPHMTGWGWKEAASGRAPPAENPR